MLSQSLQWLLLAYLSNWNMLRLKMLSSACKIPLWISLRVLKGPRINTERMTSVSLFTVLFYYLTCFGSSSSQSALTDEEKLLERPTAINWMEGLLTVDLDRLQRLSVLVKAPDTVFYNNNNTNLQRTVGQLEGNEGKCNAVKCWTYFLTHSFSVFETCIVSIHVSCYCH